MSEEVFSCEVAGATVVAGPLCVALSGGELAFGTGRVVDCLEGGFSARLETGRPDLNRGHLVPAGKRTSEGAAPQSAPSGWPGRNSSPKPARRKLGRGAGAARPPCGQAVRAHPEGRPGMPQAPYERRSRRRTVHLPPCALFRSSFARPGRPTSRRARAKRPRRSNETGCGPPSEAPTAGGRNPPAPANSHYGPNRASRQCPILRASAGQDRITGELLLGHRDRFPARAGASSARQKRRESVVRKWYGRTAETPSNPVGAPGFEPGTSCPPDKRANQAAPRPATGSS